MATSPLAVWHAAPISRVVGGLFGIVFGGALVLLGVGVLGSSAVSGVSRIVYGLLGLVLLVMTADLGLRMRVELGEDELTVVNAVRTVRIPLRDIRNVHASRYGLMIIWERDDDIKQTCASAVYKSSIPGGARLRSARADAVVERIQQACEQASSG